MRRSKSYDVEAMLVNSNPPSMLFGSLTTKEIAMSTHGVISNDAPGSGSVTNVNMKLEVVVIPVSNVDRAKKFYSRLGWRLDADRAASDNFRLIQFTPPGFGSSIQLGVNLTSAAPGSAQALHLVVSDIVAARQQLVAQGNVTRAFVRRS